MVRRSRASDTQLDRPWRWTAATGSVTINTPGSGAAHDISRDGARVIGESVAGPFIYTAGGSLQFVTGYAGAETTSFQRFSGDGQTIAGGAYTNTPTGRVGDAFRWTPQGGYTSLGQIGPLAGRDQQYTATASNLDATLIGGSQASRRAWIWDPAHGMRDLRSVLVNDFQLNLTNWTLTQVLDISADGRYLVGTGDYFNNGVTESHGWVVIIPAPPTVAVFLGYFAAMRRSRRR